MQNPISALPLILILATVVEALIEYLVAPVVEDLWSETTVDHVLRYSAAFTGVVLCLIYRADLLYLAGLGAPVPVAGEVITGLLLGRGANYVHDFATRWL